MTSATGRRRSPAALASAGLLALVAVAPAAADEPAAAAPTFARDVAPIVFASCAGCHHPGGVAPFSLLDHDSVAPRARQIAAVTRSGYMPPWLPAEGDFPFAGERRLSAEEIDTLARWAAAGAPEGDPAATPPPPRHTPGWQLGEPDLVVTLPEPFVLPAEAPGDVFRNFVLPLPVTERRWVRAWELVPDPPRAIHHAVAQVDDTPSSRQADEADPGLGFGGMSMAGSHIPDGQILGWTPGNFPDPGLEGVAWHVDPGTDLVLQLHMPPTGKPEEVRPRVGLYFADEPPTETAFTLTLGSSEIDIPAGEDDYRIRADAVLPVAVRVSSLYPHAHYLGKEMRAWAELPGGERLTLLHIPRWDFAWQDEYRFAEPVRLPAGTQVGMEFSYDNSAANPRNPHQPPRRVQWGDESSDEMGYLALQLLLDEPGDLAAVRRVEAGERLDRDPDDWRGHMGMGILLLEEGDLDGAIGHFERGLESRPGQPGLLAGLGRALGRRGDTEAAVARFREAVAAAPEQAALHFELGLALVAAGRPAEAVAPLRVAAEGLPHPEVRLALGETLLAAGEPGPAADVLAAAATASPDDARIHFAHARAAQAAGRWLDAAAAWRLALERGGDNPQGRYNLGVALVLAGQVDDALPELRGALAADPALRSSLVNLVGVLEGHPDPALRRPAAAAALRPLLD